MRRCVDASKRHQIKKNIIVTFFQTDAERVVNMMIGWMAICMLTSTMHPWSLPFIVIFTIEFRVFHSHDGRRSGRSVARSSIESIGSVGSIILRIFRFFCHVGELEICLVSKFQLCTMLGDQKKLPKNWNANFLSLSVRSVWNSVQFDRYWVRGSWWTALGLVECNISRWIKFATKLKEISNTIERKI